jgi:hypothetical protein
MRDTRQTTRNTTPRTHVPQPNAGAGANAFEKVAKAASSTNKKDTRAMVIRYSDVNDNMSTRRQQTSTSRVMDCDAMKLTCCFCRRIERLRSAGRGEQANTYENGIWNFDVKFFVNVGI